MNFPKTLVFRSSPEDEVIGDRILFFNFKRKGSVYVIQLNACGCLPKDAQLATREGECIVCAVPGVRNGELTGLNTELDQDIRVQ